MNDAVLENQLYTDAAGRATLIADKKACMDSLLINYFGFLGLYKLSDSRGYMRTYETTEGKLMLNNIGDTNHDVSLSIKLAFEAGIITMGTVNMMTKLLVLIKNKTIKGADLREQNVRDILGTVLYKTHQPSPLVAAEMNQFAAGTISLPLLAKTFYYMTRTNKHLQPITVEFRNLVMKGQYGDFFSKITAANSPGVMGATPAAPAATTVVPVTARTAPPTIAAPVQQVKAVASSLSDTVVTRYINTVGTSNKFWAGVVYGFDVVTLYGPIGNTGTINRKTFGSVSDANRHLSTMLAEKRKKGYNPSGTISIPRRGDPASTSSSQAPAVKAPPPAAVPVTQPVVSAKPAPAPAPARVTQGVSDAFFMHLINFAHDVNDMNNSFRLHGVAKSTLDLEKFRVWVAANIFNSPNWRQTKPNEDYNDIPLIKHLKSLSRYKAVNDLLKSAWVINSFEHAITSNDMNFYLNVINTRQFVDITNSDDFGTPTIKGWSYRSHFKGTISARNEKMFMTYVTDLARAAQTLEDITAILTVLKTWRNLNVGIGSNWFIDGQHGNPVWKENFVTPGMLKVFVLCGYAVPNTDWNSPFRQIIQLKFEVGPEKREPVAALYAEVPDKFKDQVIMTQIGTTKVTSMTFSEPAFNAMPPDQREAIKDITRLGSKFFTILEGSDVEAAIKGVGLKNTADTFAAAIKAANSSDIISNTYADTVFSACTKYPAEEIYKALIASKAWRSVIMDDGITNYGGRTRGLIEMLRNTANDTLGLQKYIFATFVVRSVLEIEDTRPEEFPLSSNAVMRIIDFLLKIDDSMTWKDSKSIDQAVMSCMLKNDELLDKFKGMPCRNGSDMYSCNGEDWKRLRNYVSRHFPDFITTTAPQALGFYVNNEAEIPSKNITFPSNAAFKDTLAIFYISGFNMNAVEGRWGDIAKAANLCKPGVARYGQEFVEKFPWSNPGVREIAALKTLSIFMAIYGGNESMEFTNWLAKNKEESIAGGFAVAPSIRICIDLQSYMTDKIVEVNKPQVRRIFDLTGSNSGNLANSNMVGLYLKTLTKDEIIAKLQNNELKNRIVGARGNKAILDSLGAVTAEIGDANPQATIQMFNMVEEMFKDKKTYDKSMRDSLADKLSNVLFDMHATNAKTANIIFGNVKGEIKRTLLDRAVGAALLQNLDTKLYGADALVKPLQKITPERIKELLKYNSVTVDSIRANSPAGQSITALNKEVERYAQHLAAPKVTHPPAKLSAKDQKAYLERKSVEYAKFQNYRHGDIALRFLDEFDVNIEKQDKEYSAWVKDHPGTDIMKSVFHGTGSIAASMILRFGFAVVKAGDPSCTGRMLGDGIYFSNVLDKATQYIGDAGYSRRIGLKGYILDCEAALGKEGVHYQKAGVGGAMNHIRSPEWCVRQKQQLKINKAFLCEMISKETMTDLQTKYQGKNEDVIMKITTFKQFLREAKEVNNQVITFSFMDGHVPIAEDKYVDFASLDPASFPANVSMEPSAYGPMISIEGQFDESEGFVVANTSEFMDNKEELYKFLRLAFNTVPAQKQEEM